VAAKVWLGKLWLETKQALSEFEDTRSASRGVPP
jgi:hypothetical protein